MSKVRNDYGFEMEFDDIVLLMDDEVREEVRAIMSPCTEQEFFEIYCILHEQRFGEDWEPAKPDPRW